MHLKLERQSSCCQRPYKDLSSTQFKTTPKGHATAIIFTRLLSSEPTTTLSTFTSFHISLKTGAMIPRNPSGVAIAMLLLGANGAPTPGTSPNLVRRFDSNAGYVKATCATTDASHSTSQMWSDADCGDAWNYVKDRWTNGKPDGPNLNFTAYFSHVFQGPHIWECGTFGHLSNCDQTLDHCGDQHETSGSVDTPAAYLIMNSFVQVHEV